MAEISSAISTTRTAPTGQQILGGSGSSVADSVRSAEATQAVPYASTDEGQATISALAEQLSPRPGPASVRRARPPGSCRAVECGRPPTGGPVRSDSGKNDDEKRTVVYNWSIIPKKSLAVTAAVSCAVFQRPNMQCGKIYQLSTNNTPYDTPNGLHCVSSGTTKQLVSLEVRFKNAWIYVMHEIQNVL
jgi:hypothetical protein